MTQNELRIGNFVYAKTTTETFNVVSEIANGGSSRGWYVMLENVNHGIWLEHNDRFLIEGIELTEDWILRLGFKKELDGFYRKDKSQLIEVFFHDNGILTTTQSVCLNHIKYVHEIQNIFFSFFGLELQLVVQAIT